MLTTFGALVVVLGVLIFVHELGHFLAAKAVDIAVLRFSLGFGPKTPLAFRRGETEYCVSWIPFGGYVKMAGFEEEGAAAALEGPRAEAVVPAERTFDRKPLWARLVVMIAGVAMNVAFAVAVFAGLTAVYGVAIDTTVTVGEVRAAELPAGAEALRALQPGDRILRIDRDSMTGWQAIREKLVLADSPIRIEVAGRSGALVVNVPLRDHAARARLLRAILPWHEPVAGDVTPGFPAAAAGLRRGDRIVRIAGDTIPSWERMVGSIEGNAGRSLAIDVLRDGRPLTFLVAPRAIIAAGDSGRTREVGKIGIAPSGVLVRRYGPLGSLAQGVRRSWEATAEVWFAVSRIVSGRLSASELGGPILVGQLSGEAARQGADVFLGFMALFSMNLAVLNLLPIPVLDGGNIVFLLLEAIRRRPVSLAIRQRVTTIGFLLLVMLMVFATYNDIGRLLRRLF